MRDAPGFWSEDGPSPTALALAPLAALYTAGWRLRTALARPYRPPVPLICVGNPTLGGAGKTPVAIAVAERLAALGGRPHFLSKGYGGALRGPARVDPARHRAREVGDEPLLLARTAPTHVSRSRARGAAFAAAQGAGIVVMDDGFQNPTVARDLALLVIDAASGLGNAMVFPAGPLRAPLQAQFARADAVVLIGEGAAGPAMAALAKRAGLAVLRGRLRAEDGSKLAGRDVVAFSGIGRPEKFYDSLRKTGANILAERSFPDHHPYSAADVSTLARLAASHGGAALVTTEKDFVRFDEANDPGGAFRARLSTLPVRAVFDDVYELDRLLSPLVRPSAPESSR